MARATVTGMLRLPRRLALAVLLGALPAACLSPTLPLPPPSKPEKIEGPDAQGIVTLTGTLPQPRARAIVFNQREGDIDQTGADAAYVLRIPAAPGEELEFWYEIGLERSPSIVFLVPAAADAGTGAPNDAGADAAPTDAGDGGL